ncbi:MAG: hypothetical protein IPK33_22185 [Gemmatimonadetes bacterium]|nr:hypothetical protein [Gemmatimonadota bacterium]
MATISARHLLPLLYGMSMGSLGLRIGDVMTATCGAVTRHFQADSAPALLLLSPEFAAPLEVT